MGDVDRVDWLICLGKGKDKKGCFFISYNIIWYYIICFIVVFLIVCYLFLINIIKKIWF